MISTFIVSCMRTKIVATYGPGIAPRHILSKVLKHVDVVRINFSHANEEAALRDVDNVTSVSRSIGKEVALMADLPGPKIRLGIMKSSIDVKRSDTVTLRYGAGAEAKGRIPLGFDLYRYLKKGSIISIGDGYLNLSVEKLTNGDITCRALGSGTLSSRKGLNIRNGNVTAAPPTAQDVTIAKFAKKAGFDFIAMSFVRSAQNILDMRRKIGDAYIISKIERAEAVKRIDEISAESDAIMVARGDLAFEVGVEMIPIMQTRIIHSAIKFHKPVIVATHMLMSMVNNPMPTRAEVTDIATAVLSSADCLMMSDETAVGKYPVEAVRTMATTARNAEEIAVQAAQFKITNIEQGIAYAAKELADNYRTGCIFTPTESGHTAMTLSAMRSKSEIIALSRFEKVRRRLSLYYGVHSIGISYYRTTEDLLSQISGIAKRRGIRRYIVVSGVPHTKGSTKMLQYIAQ